MIIIRICLTIINEYCSIITERISRFSAPSTLCPRATFSIEYLYVEGFVVVKFHAQ
jgi:hypothetical protein